jgi:hypothetical protein
MPVRLVERRPSARAKFAAAIVVLGVGALAGCHSGSNPAAAQPGGAGVSSSASAAAVAASAADSASAGLSSAASAASGQAAGSGGGAKCTDLTNAAASAAVGKATTVTLDTTATALAGLTICKVTVASEVYPIQLDVMTNGASALFSADKNAFSGTGLSGVGDQAFSSAVGIEALSGSVDIKVNGPAGPVLNNDYTVPTALVKAMIAAL